MSPAPRTPSTPSPPVPASESRSRSLRFGVPMGALLAVSLALWGLGGGGVAPTAAQSGEPPDSRAIAPVPDVLILQPKVGETVFGPVEVVAEVLSAEPITEVIFQVDGREVARVSEPPYRTTVDVGQDNVEHTFEVVAVSDTGAEGRALRTTPRITVDEKLDIELQQLYVTVTRRGVRILHIPRDNFRILDDGQPQAIVTFEPGDVPLTAAILVDASFSMKGERLRLAVRGARSFVEDMKDLDEATLMLFSDRLLYATPFTKDPEALTAALNEVHAGGGTAINDHLYLALKWLEAEQGRRVVILLTDGVDVESTLDMDKVLWMVGRSQTLVYWIRLTDEESELSRFTAWRDAEGHRQQIAQLGQAVTESGGRIVDIQDLQQAESVFREILRELREQYVLGYYPSHNVNDGSWHDVKVEVEGDVQVRTREGYIDF
jgi:Ca-activated chloride channel family protein